MKLLSSSQIHEWDAYTIKHEPVSSIDLMERAAKTCTDFIIEKHRVHQPIKIFCGKGNNGGDGLAIARQLTEANVQPEVYILEFGAKGTDDFQQNLHRLHQLTSNIHFIQAKEFFPSIQKNEVVIDALFGSGLNRPLESLSKELVLHINAANATVISIDVPSGMYIDKSSKDNAVIKAHYTLTFQSLKLCFLAAENADLFGEVFVQDIGLDKNYLQKVETTFELATPSLVRSFLKPRKLFSHKGNFGHALLIAGNKGKMGAAVMASKACLRSGAGLLTVNVPEQFFPIIHTTIPEAMCIAREESIAWKKFSCLGIGPGLGTNEDALQLINKIFYEYRQPIVIDADALNIISADKKLFTQIPLNSILTPHPKEFERLFGKTANDFERMTLAAELSAKNSIIIILKGHYTLIAANGKGFFNTTGNAGMATGGSGDVLTGMIVSLLAQGYSYFGAAVAAVYLHGLAGDIALQQQSLESLLPSDIVKNIGKAFRHLQEKEVQE